MTTASVPNPGRPLRVVYTPTDAEGARQALAGEKNRWRVFLNAKGLLLGYIKATTAAASRVIARLHLTGAARMIRRASGWLFGGIHLVRRGLSTAGVKPGIAWLLSTAWGLGLIKRAGKAVGDVLSTAARSTMKVVGWCLRLFGGPGKKVADKLETKTQNLWSRIVESTRSLRANVSALLSPSGVWMQGVGTLAKGRALSELLKRWMPSPWNILARVIANVMALPASVRRDALRLLGHWTSKAKSAPTPEHEPTPPATDQTKDADVVDLDAERAEREAHEQVELDEVEPSLQRYPASKARQTKRKR